MASWNGNGNLGIRAAGRIAAATAMLVGLAACDGDGGSTDPGTVREDVPADVDAGIGDDAAGDPAGEAIVPPDAPPDTDVAEAPGKVRFLHISDLHVYGDAATPLTGPLEAVVAALNALDFDADFVAATGDYVDFLPDTLQPGDPSTFTAAIDTLAGLRFPVRTMAGNHEYYRNVQLEPTADKEARDAYLQAALGHPLDETFDLRGVRFVLMNTMLGDLWKTNQGLVASFTDAQVAWLRGLLDGGLPTVLLLHHPPTSGAVTPMGDSLCRAIEDHPGVVKGVFAGHLHGFWKGEACGVPYWLVGNADATKPFFFEVEADGAAGTVTVLNEADVPFGTVPTFECDPSAPGIEDPSVLAGTNQVIHVGSMTSNLPGLEGFEGDGLDKVPLVLHLDTWDKTSKRLTARLSEGVLDAGFVRYLQGAPCASIAFDVDGSCASSVDTGFELNLLPLLRTLLDVTPDPSWVARLDITSLRLEGRFGPGDGSPRFEEGLMHLSASGTRALSDLRGILVGEYCGNRIAGCEPGSSDDLPACPDGADETFFDDVPEACDVSLGNYSLRLLLGLVAAYPLDNVVITGGFATVPAAASATPVDGAVDASMFDTATGNCSADPGTDGSPVR